MEAGEPPIRRNTSYRTSPLLTTGPTYSALHGSRERRQASDQAKGSALRVRRDCRPNLGLRGTGTGPDKRFSPCRDFERLGRLHHLRLDGLLFHPRPSGVFLCSAVGAEVHLEVKLFASSVARKDSPTCGAGRRITSHLPDLLLARSPPFADSSFLGTDRHARQCADHLCSVGKSCQRPRRTAFFVRSAGSDEETGGRARPRRAAPAAIEVVSQNVERLSGDPSQGHRCLP